MKGIIGKKIGMTSIFGTDGKQTACTIIEAGPCVVTQVKTQDTDGYTCRSDSLTAKRKKRTPLRPKSITSQRPILLLRSVVKEFRNYSLDKALGETITVDIFAEGENVEVVGTTKGKGFQGVVKRHGFHGVGEALTVSTTVREHRVLSVVHLILHVYLKVCVWQAVWVQDRVKVKGLKVVKIFPEKNYIINQWFCSRPQWFHRFNTEINMQVDVLNIQR